MLLVERYYMTSHAVSLYSHTIYPLGQIVQRLYMSPAKRCFTVHIIVGACAILRMRKRLALSQCSTHSYALLRTFTFFPKTFKIILSIHALQFSTCAPVLQRTCDKLLLITLRHLIF